MHIIEQILKNSLTITAFVLSMMLLIEYINVKTKGTFSKGLKKSRFKQILLASIFGVIPGCLGTYTVVSLYTHKLLGVGALVAALIATSGDEAFYLFSMSPETGFIVSAALFVIAIVFGFLSDILFEKKDFLKKHENHLTIHDDEIDVERIINLRQIKEQLRNISFHRALLLISIVVFIVFILFNGTGHTHEFVGGHLDHDEHGHGSFDWIAMTFIVISSLSLFIILTVSDHFLEDHLWKHIIKKHFLKVFVWTVLALIVIKFLDNFVDFHVFVNEHKYYVMFFALLIGLIPESGPHMIFVTMFLSGNLPLSILLANSIVQDGHGALPLFAESKKSFFFVKFINFLVGGFIGYILLFFGQ